MVTAHHYTITLPWGERSPLVPKEVYLDNAVTIITLVGAAARDADQPTGISRAMQITYVVGLIHHGLGRQNW